MIDLKYTLDSKPIIKKKDGTEITDLAAPSLNQDVTFTVLDYFMVRNNEQMRPDTIAQRYYGNIKNVEMLMKLNAVSNPFSIDEGDIMVIADPVTGRSAMINNAVVNRGDVRKQYFQPEKEGKPDPKLKVFSQRQVVKPSKKKNGQALPPNYANPGDKELEIIGGKIVFGTNVSAGGTGTTDVPLEKQKFLDSLKNNSAVKKVQKLSTNLLGDTTTTGIIGGSGAGNITGVPNANLSPAEKAAQAAQAAKREQTNQKLASKVNLAKSEVIAKLIKDLFKI